MVDKSNMRFQKEVQIVVDPQSLKNNTLQPSKQRFLSPTLPGSATSMSQSLELPPSKASDLALKNQHMQKRSISLLTSNQGKTHAIPDEFDLRLSEQSNNRQNENFSKTEEFIKEGSKGGKRMEDGGFKCCFPGFGKAKQVKARKIRGNIEMDHSVYPVVSSAFSFEFNSGVTTQGRNNEDESLSSYFELPSTML